MNRDIWVCMPTYNEYENLERTLSAVWRALPEASVLIIDDGSPDGTGALADHLAASEPRLKVLHRAEKAGLGAAYLAGFRNVLARGATRVIQMDADLSHDPKVLPELVEALERYSVAVGSRLIAGGGVEGWGLHRRLISKLGNLYADAMLNLPIKDLTGGYNAYRSEVLERLDERSFETTGYGFQIELKWFALSRGYQAVEIPIWFRDRELGKSKMSLANFGEAAWRVWRLRNEAAK